MKYEPDPLIKGTDPFILDKYKKYDMLLFCIRISIKAVEMRITSKEQAEIRKSRKNRKIM